MNIEDMTLAQWQVKLKQFRRENWNAKLSAAFRVDGTQFSVGAMYGGFTFNGDTYKCFYFPKEGNVVIAVREDFLRWLKKNLKKEMAK